MTDAATLPLRLIAGDSLALRLPAAGEDYPSADGWTVAMALAPASGGALTSVSGTDDGDAWLINLTASASAALTAGQYDWVIRASRSGERATIQRGTLTVEADVAANVDRRSHARRVLDLIEAAIEGRASDVDLEYVFDNGRSVKMMGHDELFRMRDRYRREVAREEGRGAGGRPVRIVPRI